ncbi:DEAD/DEAH box helicase, partial [Paenibacillus sp. IB182496]
MTNHWQELGVAEALSRRLAEQGLTAPAAVQREAIVPLLRGEDALVQAPTGSGKTLAYLLPLLQRIDPALREVQSVVVAPTQELAMQILQVAKDYGEPLGIRVLPLIGGAALKRQLEKLREHPQLVVGTPGRLRELLGTRKLKLHETRSVVIDEVDRVIGEQTAEDAEAILRAVRRDTQVACFSATMPAAIADKAGSWLKQPVRIAIDAGALPEQVEHVYVVADQRHKIDTVRRLLRNLELAPALLFVNETAQIGNWESKLAFEGFAVEALYGDADKQSRARTLARFRSGGCEVLMATDVAARGLDVEGLPLVVNVDPPLEADQYVHRAGRTGRMGRTGLVVTLVTPSQQPQLERIGRRLALTLEERRLAYGKLAAPDASRGRRGGRTAERAPGEPAHRTQSGSAA